MHYKNGRPAKIGDQIVFKPYDAVIRAGVVAAAAPGSSTCNLTVVTIGGDVYSSVTASEAVHGDDAMSPAPYVDEVGGGGTALPGA